MEIKKQANKISMEAAIFYPVALLATSATLVVSILLFFTIQNEMHSAFEARLMTVRNIFTDSIRNDILTGAYAEVYRKCTRFFDDQEIKTLTISTADHGPICDLAREVDVSGTINLNDAIYFDGANTETAASIQMAYSILAFKEARFKVLLLLALTVSVLIIGLLIITKSLSKRLTQPITFLTAKLKEGDLIELAGVANSAKNIKTRELDILFTETSTLATRLIQTHKDLLERRVQEAQINLAKQVAHDIRSPVAALSSVAEQIDELHPDARSLIRLATKRIAEISNSLMDTSKIYGAETPGNFALAKPKINSHLLYSLVEPIVQEKRMELSSLHNIQIDYEPCPNNNIFVEVDAVEFKRVVSNVINNSIEALSGQGVVRIGISCVGDKVTVYVIDNGKGIPDGVVSKLGTKGFSFEKETGSGLGLSHAFSTIESTHGTLLISSKIDIGTDVRIQLPIAQSPEWHVPELILHKKSRIVILDDEQVIHEAWKLRLSFIDCIELVHFYSAQDFASCVIDLKNANTIFLVDYELRSSQTGIDLITSYDIVSNSILITGQEDDLALRIECKENGIRLLPKTHIALIPIRVES